MAELGTEDKGTVPGRDSTERLIRTCVKLYVRTGCGFRGVSEALSVISEEYGVAKAVSHQTVSDWVKTAGLAMYKEARGMIRDCKMKYSFVVDESITIGSQKLLLVLAIPAGCPGHALRHEDVKVVGIFVERSWKSEDVAGRLREIVDEIGYKPEYVLSDNGHNLVKAASDLELPHHRDIGHTLGLFLEEAYDDDKMFNEFKELMRKARLQYHLTGKAFLLPPKQRAMARFMNLFSWVDWAVRLLLNYNQLTEEQKLAFAFVPAHRDLILELAQAMECYTHVMQRVKNEGLSIRLCNELRDYIVSNHIYPGNLRLTRVMMKVWDYLKAEAALLKPGETHNLSSDIIESIFGIFKQKKSPNHLYGVTPFVLFIPAHTAIVGMHDTKSVDFMRIFSDYHNKEVDDWKVKNLKENWVRTRTKTLAKAG